jgi:hypothetical protein
MKSLNFLFLAFAVVLFLAASMPKITARFPKWHLTAAGLAAWVLSTLFGFGPLSVPGIILAVAFIFLAAAASAEFDKKVSEVHVLPTNMVPLGLALWALSVLLSSQHLLPS